MEVEEARSPRGETKDREFTKAVYRLSPAGTTEVADLVGMSRQATEYRLKKIEREKGYVWSKKIGQTRVWLHHRLLKAPLLDEAPDPSPYPDEEDAPKPNVEREERDPRIDAERSTPWLEQRQRQQQ